MTNSKLLTKKIWMAMLILFFGVITTQAATVTYTLTTHVDGRTITGTANLNAGADLLNSMPQDLWRAYCTYTFYSDEAKTQEITTAPAENATVYVDYVFDPPFIVTPEGEEEVWHYIRTYNSGGDNNYLIYLKQKVYPEYEGIWGHKYSYSNQTPSYGKNGTIDKNADMAYAGHCQWAFYGDSYSLNIKINDTEGQQLAGTYLLWPTTLNTINNLRLGAKAELGWQLYVNTTQKQDKKYNWYSYPTMVMGVPNSNWYVDLENVSYAVRMGQLSDKYEFDSHNQLVPKSPIPSTQASQIKRDQWWFGLYATPIGSGKDLNYNVTYKILQYDGTWYYKDIVKAQTDSYGNPKQLEFPTEYTKKEGCTYDYYYKDEDFTVKYADNYVMPNTENIVVYILEIKYVSTPWMTLVLPFGIDNLPAYFGADDAVQVNEYTSVEGKLNGSGNSFSCKLNFIATDKIEAGKPYLFKADKVSQAVLDAMYATEVPALPELIEVKKYDTNAPGIGVSMKGVLGSEYSMPNDGMHFYFGSKQNGDDYTYGFYLRGATIKPNRCYFFVTDERAGATSPLTLNFGDNGFTGIGQMTVEATANEAIYSISGQQMRTTSTANLPKGLYIVNGKKIIVK